MGTPTSTASGVLAQVWAKLTPAARGAGTATLTATVVAATSADALTDGEWIAKGHGVQSIVKMPSVFHVTVNVPAVAV